MEISVDSDAGDLVQDVNDGVSIAVRDTAVIRREPVSCAGKDEPKECDGKIGLKFRGGRQIKWNTHWKNMRKNVKKSEE